MSATAPRSFTEVPGWREAFRDAAKRLDEVRTGSLFPDLPTQVCGEPVRLFSMQDWTVLDQADNPLVAGGAVSLAHCCNLLWLLSPRYRRDGWIARFLRRRLSLRVLRRAGYDEAKVIHEVMDFVDDAFLDWPGRFAAPSKSGGISPVQWPRKAREIELCGEVMQAYPSFRYEELRAMPLAQFWQWLHDARGVLFERAGSKTPYRNYQLTDEVNQQACDEANRLRREAAQQSPGNN